MPTCPYCQQTVRWWVPLVTRRGELFECTHCYRSLRIDRRRYAWLYGVSVSVIASTNLVPTEHPYLLVLTVSALAIIACVLFGKVEGAESDDEDLQE